MNMTNTKVNLNQIFIHICSRGTILAVGLPPKASHITPTPFHLPSDDSGKDFSVKLLQAYTMGENGNDANKGALFEYNVLTVFYSSFVEFRSLFFIDFCFVYDF